jgi:hypothetical protein
MVGDKNCDSGGVTVPFRGGQITRAVSTPFTSYQATSDLTLPQRCIELELCSKIRIGAPIGKPSRYEIDIPSCSINLGGTYTRRSATPNRTNSASVAGHRRYVRGGNTFRFDETDKNLTRITMPSGYLSIGLSNTYPQGRRLNNYQFVITMFS